MELYAGSPFLNDVELRHDGVIRIYDILFDYSVLLDTDAFVRQVIQGPEFQKTMGTDEFHHLLGRYVYERERKLGLKDTSVLSAAYQYGVPIFTSSPGDSSIGMNVAAMALRDSALQFDVNRDVNQTAAIVYDAKSGGADEQRLHPGRRLAEEFHPANGAANPGGDGHRGARARLLPAMHGRAAGHRRPLRRDAGGGGELGKDRPG